MDLTALRYLSASAESGTFARAAKLLGLHASTISRVIGRLEDELGLTLFERGRTGIRLTAGGKSVMVHVRRVLAEVDSLKLAGEQRGSGRVGEIRLGIRVPPVGEPARGLLRRWRESHPKILLTVVELNEHHILVALEERRMDVALIPSFALWPHTATLPLYRERLVVALPSAHPLAQFDTLNWATLFNETILVQGWDDSHAAREFYASFLGSGAKFQMHAASKQSLFALVGVGFGITLTAESQSEAAFPGVVFKPLDEPDAWVRIDMVWLPEAEDPVVGSFVAFMRDEARSRKLLWTPSFSA